MGKDAEQLLILLAMHRVRRLLDGDLRLRTACDLEPIDRNHVLASRPAGFALPLLTELESSVEAAIKTCAASMTHTTVKFDDDMKKAKDVSTTGDGESNDAEDEQGD